MRNDIRCSYCGKHEVYAKGLCISCYNRRRKNGGVMIPSRTELMQKRWIGIKVDGWELIETLPKGKALMRCMNCGRTKIASRNNLSKHNIRPCACQVEHLEPKTETQARVYRALLHNKGSATKAAKDLGLSRQAVWAVLNTMRKNKNA